MPRSKPSKGRQALELTVLDTVYDQAMARAKSQGQRLATVARTILFQEASRTPSDATAPESMPRRPYEQARKTIKFSVDASAYATAKDRIYASGRSVAAAVEDGLRSYAVTGVVENFVVVDETRKP